MLTAIRTNTLEIAMLLAKDGHFPSDLSCVLVCTCQQPEMFQWLVRDLIDSISGRRESSDKKAASSLFMQDAFIELEHLAVNN